MGKFYRFLTTLTGAVQNIFMSAQSASKDFTPPALVPIPVSPSDDVYSNTFNKPLHMPISTTVKNVIMKPGATFARRMMTGLVVMLLTVCFSATSIAQVAVTVDNPTNTTPNLSASYTSLSDAITALNTVTSVSGPVQLTLAAAGTETAPVGGYVINYTAATSGANNITIEGNGSTITAAAGLTSGNINDAVFKIVGSDFLTLKGFIINDNTNAFTTVATNTKTEFGIALYAASTTNGAKNNTIQGNTINLGTSGYTQSFGIFSTSTFSAASTTTVTAQASVAGGENSGNKVYANTISNVAFGILVVSPVTTATFSETGWDIGGTALATGNNITYRGNAAITTSYTNVSTTVHGGIIARNVVGVNIQYNTVTSGTISTAAVATNGIVISAGSTPAGVTYTNTVSNNTVNLTSSTNTSGTVYGIDFGYGLISTGTIVSSNNSITINQNTVNTATSGAIFGIKANYAAASSTLNSNNVTINQTASVTASTTNSSPITAISLPSGTTGTPTMTALLNTVAINRSSSATVGTSTLSGTITGIQATSSASTLVIGSVGNGNTITIKEAVGGAGTNTFSSNIFFVDAGASHGTANVVGNTFNTTGGSLRSTGTQTAAVRCEGTVSVLYNIKSNVANIDRIATSGTAYFTYQTGGPSNVADTVSLNTITFTGLTGTSAVTGISQLGGLSTTTLKSIYGNTINITGNNTGASRGIAIGYSGAAGTKIGGNSITISTAAPTLIGIDAVATSAAVAGGITFNTLSLTSTSTSPTSMIGINCGATGPFLVANNTFTTLNFSSVITGSPVVTGIAIASGTGNNVNNNLVTNITVGAAGSTGSPVIDGILVSGGTSTNIFKNTICGISTLATGTGTTVNGIRLSSGTTNNIYNNRISGLTASAAASTDALRGISITSTSTSTTHNVSFNTIYLNGSSTGANFGSSGIFHTTSATATTSALVLRNNIIVNTSTPAGTGLTVAFRRSSGAANTLANYNSASNKNDFYAGTPGASNLIYADGTSTAQTIAAFTGGAFTAGTVAPRDASSFSENPNFLSTVCGNANQLKIDPAISTQLESAGATVSGITDDFEGEVRNVTTPDVGADEFNGTSPSPVIVLNSITPAGNQCTAVSRAISATVTTPSGTITSVTLNYNNGAAGSVSMTNTSGDIWEGTIPVASPTNSTVTYNVVAINSLSVSTSVSGASYKDDPLLGYAAIATASPTAVCPGAPVTLSAAVNFSGGGTVVLGAGASTSSSSGVTMFPGSWGGAKTQYIIRASELQALGLTAGNITSIAFEPTTAGQTYTGFAVNIGHTALTAMTSTLVNTGLTQVYAGTLANNGFLPVANTLNTLTFGTGGTASSFAWDGTSNILLSFCWSTVTGATTATSSTVLADAPGFTCTGYGQSDATLPSAFCPLTTGFGTSGTGTSRPKFTIVGVRGLPITASIWSDGTNTVGSTNPLTVNPTANTSYTATLTASGCPIVTNSADVTINPVPLAPTAAVDNTEQCGSAIPTVQIASNGGNGNFNWYDAASGGNLVQTGTSTTFTQAIGSTSGTPSQYNNGPGTYIFYVSELNASGCESPRTPLTVVVTSPAAASSAISPAPYCVGSSISFTTNDITSAGYTFVWSSASAGAGLVDNGDGTATATPTTSGSKIYTVLGTQGTCTYSNSFTITVGTIPTIYSATANPATICETGSTILTGLVGGSSTAVLGAGATNSSSTGVTLFPGSWGGAKTQYIIRASELQALGIVAGNITSLAFEPTNAGQTYQGFGLSIGHTTLTSMTSTLVGTGLTQVYAGTLANNGYLPVANTVNTLAFGTGGTASSFNWDGTSNILISFCWSSVPNASTASSTTVKSDAPGFTCTGYGQSDNTSPATFCPLTTGFGSSGTGTSRPRFTFGAQVAGAGTGVSWLWSNGATTNTTTVSPTTSTAYTVNLTETASGCVSPNSTVNVTVLPLASAPVDQPTAFNTTAVTTTSVSASFTAAASAPGGYLVVRYLGGVTPTTPVNGTNYSAGASLGAGTVVSAGTSTIFNNTGLTANTTYDYYIYSYTITPVCGLNVYNAVTPLTQSVTTCAAVTGIPGTPTAGTVSNNSFTVNWTASSTPGVSYLVDVSTSSTFATFVPGYFAYDAGTGLSATINTGITGNTIYYVRVKAVITGCASDNSGTLTLTTACDPENAPTVAQQFGTYVPVCWTEATGALDVNSTLTYGSSAWSSETGFGNTGSNPAVRINLFSTKNDWIISQPINLGTGNGYSLIYKYAVTSFIGTTAQATLGTHKVDVVISTDNGVTWSNANTLKTYQTTPPGGGNWSTTGVLDTLNLSAYSGVIKIGFVATTTSSTPDIDFHIDSVVVKANCIAPTTQASNLVLTPNTTAVAGTFDAAAGVDGYLIVRTDGTAAPSNPVNGTIYAIGASALGGTIVAAGNSTTFNSTGLVFETQYTYTIFTYNNLSCTNAPAYNVTAPVFETTTTLGLPMEYVSSTTTQAVSSPAFTGLADQQVIGVQIVTINNQNPLTPDAFVFNTNGSTESNVPMNITTAKLYYTGNSSTFATTTLIGSFDNPPGIGSGNFVIPNGSAIPLQPGTNYYWLTYDVPGTAVIDDVLDAECELVVVGGTPYTPDVTAPAGSRIIKSKLNGPYLVGPGQTAPNYASLTSAVADLTAYGVSGPVSFLLQSNYSSAAETFPIVLPAFDGASATNTVTIKPDAGVTATISGIAATTNIFKINGGDYYVIDGSNNGTNSRNLTITTPNTATSGSGLIWLASATASNGATNNVIKNLILTGNTATTTQMGIFSGGTASISSTGVALANNASNTIDNNLITKTQYGIYAAGVSTTNLGTGLNITNNRIGATGTGNGITVSGIYVSLQDGANVTGNTITNQTNTGSTVILDASSSQSTNVGLLIRNSKNSSVTKNIITGMNIGGSSTIRAYAIGLDAPAFSTVGNPSNNLVANNMVSDSRYSGTGSSTWQFSGINDNGGYGDKFYFNSVSLTGAFTNTSGPNAAFSNGNAGNTVFASNIEVYNNIFYINTTGGTSTYYAHYTRATDYTGSLLDNNVLSVTTGATATGNIGFISATAQTSFAEWQGATGQEAASKNVVPVFNAINDLHLLGSSAVNVASLYQQGINIPAVTTDIDNDTRAITPTIGADELLPCSGANGGTANAAVAAFCGTTGIGTIITASGYSSAIGGSHQWQSSTTADFSTAVTDISGATNPSALALTTAISTPGITYFRLKAICGVDEAYSNIIAITVNPAPTATITASATTFCTPTPADITLTATTDLVTPAPQYQWKLNGTNISGATSATYTILGTAATVGSYTVDVTNTSTSCTTTSLPTVLSSAVRPTVTATATPNPICVGSSLALNGTVSSTAPYSVTAIPYAFQTLTSPNVLASGGVNNTVSPVTYNGTSLDDGGWNNVPIGFTFNFYGTSYNNITVGTNGNLQFGVTTAATNAAPGATSGSSLLNNFIGGAWIDVDVRTSGTIRYQTLGTAPNRKFVAEWNGPVFLSTDNLISQIVLNESDNTAEVHFQQFTNSASSRFTIAVKNSNSNFTVAPSRDYANISTTVDEAYRFTPGTLSYSWSGPNTFTSSVINPSISNITTAEAGTYSLTATQSNGCARTGTVVVAVQTPGTWTGTVSTAWSVPGNWGCSILPASGADVVIPNTTNKPALDGNITVGNLDLQTGASITVGANTFSINGAVSGTGVLRGSAASNLSIGGTGAGGTLYFDQTTDGTTNAFNNITMNKTSGGTLALGNKLVLLDTYTPTAGVLSTGDFLTIRSTAAKTARIAQGSATGNYITGSATVERYISNNGGNRAWRMLSIPTQGAQTIKEAWMENQPALNNGIAGYGTIITSTTGTAGGYDFLTPQNSLLEFNQSTGAYTTPATTAVPIATTSGYFIYIRGSRAIGPSASTTAADATTLRTFGTLYQGNQPARTLAREQFAMIGNVYASAIDFTGLDFSGALGATINKFYTWDPKVQSGTQLGIYQTFSPITGFEPVPGGGSYPAGVPNTRIESGQAFFVYAAGNPGTTAKIALRESAKVGGTQLNVFRPTTPAMKFKTSLFNGSSLIDGNVVVMDPAYSNDVDADDAYKLANNGENLAIQKGTQKLVVEGKQLITDNDTIYFNMWNVRQQAYRFEFEGIRMNATGLTAFLVDNYLNSLTPIDLNVPTSVNFTVDANAASAASNRFKVVFKNNAPVPVTFTSITANYINAGVQVDWKVALESGIRHYVIEYSTDGRNFSSIGLQAATGNNGGAVNYGYFHASPIIGANYYRIRSVDLAGIAKFTNIVKVTVGKGSGTITVSPNPVQGSVMNIQFTNQVKGRYTITLINTLGQRLYQTITDHTGGSTTRTFNLPSLITGGAYQLEIITPDNNRQVQKVIINTTY